MGHGGTAVSLRSTLRPRRRLALPFLVFVFPLLWVTVRGTSVARGPPPTRAPGSTLAFVAAAVVGSYLLAAVEVTVLAGATESWPRWARRLLEPSDAALGWTAAISLALAAYVGGSSLVTFPAWVETVARGAGLVVGWPLVVTTLATYAVGNAVPGGLPFTAQVLATMVGVALSAVWIVVLSTWLAARVAPGRRS